jgi:hypothetical protein
VGPALGWAGRHRLAGSGVLLLVSIGVAALMWPSATVDRPAAAAAAPRTGCSVAYAVRSIAGCRSSITLTVSNETGPALNDWSLRFVLPAGQRLIHGSNGTWHQQGDTVRVAGPGLAPGAVVTTGFDATYRTAIALPQSFTLNDTACRSQLSVLTVAAGTPVVRSTTKARPVTHTKPGHRKVRPPHRGLRPVPLPPNWGHRTVPGPPAIGRGTI